MIRGRRRTGRAAVPAADRASASWRVYRYHGFWQSMDTFKDKITLDRMEARGDCPWMIWKTSAPGVTRRERRHARARRTARAAQSRLRVLCLGAHCDDIEIGCGATLLRLAGERALDVTWACAVLDAAARRRGAQQSATRFLRKARAARGPHRGASATATCRRSGPQAKDTFEALKRLPRPDLIFTHERDDRHQDHRLVCELTWNTFRDHTILEYEIPKYDGGLGQPNFFVPVTSAIAQRKVKSCCPSYPSQRDKRWFTEDAFLALMRLRGIECNAIAG